MKLIVIWKGHEPLKINVDGNITLLELKKKIANYYNESYTGFNILNGNKLIDCSEDQKTLTELNIKRLITIPIDYWPGGCIDNIKNEIDLSIGFDMNLIKRNELNVNLIHFDLNMTNSENYEYFNNFKVDVVGGFYAIDDINIFKKFLQKISEKHIPFLVVSSGSGAKEILFVKNILLLKRLLYFVGIMNIINIILMNIQDM